MKPEDLNKLAEEIAHSEYGRQNQIAPTCWNNLRLKALSALQSVAAEKEKEIAELKSLLFDRPTNELYNRVTLRNSDLTKERDNLKAKLDEVEKDRDYHVKELHDFRTTYELFPDHRDIVKNLRNQLSQLTEEKEKWETAASVNADDARDAHRNADERRLAIIQLNEEKEKLSRANAEMRDVLLLVNSNIEWRHYPDQQSNHHISDKDISRWKAKIRSALSLSSIAGFDYVKKEELVKAMANMDLICDNIHKWWQAQIETGKELREELTKANELLMELEWNTGSLTEGEPDYCAICSRYKNHGHAEDCKLSSHLNKPENK